MSKNPPPDATNFTPRQLRSHVSVLLEDGYDFVPAIALRERFAGFFLHAHADDKFLRWFVRTPDLEADAFFYVDLEGRIRQDMRLADYGRDTPFHGTEDEHFARLGRVPYAVARQHRLRLQSDPQPWWITNEEPHLSVSASELRQDVAVRFHRTLILPLDHGSIGDIGDVKAFYDGVASAPSKLYLLLRSGAPSIFQDGIFYVDSGGKIVHDNRCYDHWTANTSKFLILCDHQKMGSDSQSPAS